ncbi:MAG TPA: hypothetical protein VNM37_12040 [Candidatus Dormibacteraeota bacterium]|nr:hypothetical protein [Candidatus Dormibacteraeota bacterium]
MTVEEVLVLLSGVAPLVPVPQFGPAVLALVTLARALEAEGLFHGAQTVDLSTIGDARRQAVAELVAALAKGG